MRTWLWLIVAALAVVAAPAPAQTPPQNPPPGTPTRIRGTVEQFDEHNLIVKTRDGQTATIVLADNFTVSALTKKTATDIKPNDYIFSTGIKGNDGKLRCVELRIAPEASRGVAEGQTAWDTIPDSTMTNATVTGIAAAGGAQTVKVKFKDQESEFVVDAKCEVFGYIPGDAGLLKPGAAIFTVALKKPDGSLTASRITAEKDGIKPQF
jgi:hypothetical protein